MLSLDAMDLSGEQHINIQHNIFKRKLDLDGQPLQEPQKQESNYYNFFCKTKIIIALNLSFFFLCTLS